MLGGLAAFDFNNDNCTDLFFSNGASLPTLQKSSPEFHNRLYRNNCDGTFTDSTASSGLAGAGYSMGAATADYDNDGFADLFVPGVHRNFLYRNLGDGRFSDVTQAAGLAPSSSSPRDNWSVAAGWLDYDNDGLLDLFISNYVAWDEASEPVCGPPENRFYCHPNAYRGLPNQLFHNEGGGVFKDVSLSSGIARHIGKGMGLAFADFDQDGFTDIYVANDSMRSFLFRNQCDGTFREIGLEAGVALREDGATIAGMGVDFRDYDNDARPDLLVSGMISDGFLLFRNTGRNALFDDAAQRSGLLLPTRSLTGWSIAMADLDNDGWKDLFFALSHFPRLEKYTGNNAALPNRVFRNLAGRRFEDVSSSAGAAFQIPALHHGSALADFDNDGRLDVAVSALNSPAKILRNVTPGDAHWLALRLKGTRSNRQGLGARVLLTLPDGRTLSNHATTCVGYASSSEPLVRFGLGPHPHASRIEILWPSGTRQLLSDVSANRVLDVTEAAP
jgi:hypothetical protein